MTRLRHSIDNFTERMGGALDDMYVAIEARDTAAQHVALAALVGLLEMLRAELNHADDEEEE
jgi:hypothetical protein